MATNSDSNTNHSDTMEDINSINHPLYFYPHDHPYFYPHDHPGVVRISKKLTSYESYSVWKRSMMIALSARNKIKLVNGDFEELDLSSPLFGRQIK